MQTQHLIDTVLFDIGFSDEETAFEAQSELEVFCKRQLLGVVEQVFDRASQAGLVMRLPSLEIDLGSVAYQDCRDELPRRLRERLGQLLAEWRVDADGRTATQGAVIERRRADYQLLEYFLLRGHLPWYADPRDETALDGLLDQVLSTHAARLRGFLQTTPHRHRVVARLAGQFSNPGMARLFRLLAPSHAADVGPLMETLALAWGEDNRISVALGLNQVAALGLLWRFLIELVLEKDGRQESARELMSRALRIMLIERYGVDRSILTAFIEYSDPVYTGDLQALFQPLVQTRGDILSQPTGALSEGPEDEMRREQDNHNLDAAGEDGLRARLLQAILTGDSGPIDAIWSELRNKHGALLERLLRRQGQRAEIRRRLAQGFKEAQLRDILEMLEPLEHAFVSRVIDDYGAFRSAQGGSGAPRTSVRLIWEFSLGYLLVERGSRFNKKSYLGSLLRQMAAAENRAYRELLDVLLDNLATAGVRSGTGREMRQLLLELRQEQNNAAAEEDSEAFPETRGSRLYSRLFQALGDARGNTADAQRVIDELLRTYPWQLLRLLRELQAGVIQASTLPKVFSPPLLQQLVMAFVDLTIPKGSELRDALAANERRAGDPARYFRRLLICLVRQRPIDFKELLGADAEDETVETGIRLETQESDALVGRLSPIELSDAVFMQRLECFLSGEIQLTTGERQALMQGMSRRFARQSQALVRLLPKPAAQRVEGRIARLVSLLPDAALADMLADWLGPGSLDMLHGADLITTACLSCPLGVPATQLRRLKWEYLLGYLLESGPLLDEAGFLRGCVEYLARHTAQADGEAFRADLGRQLLVDLLPSTRSLVQRIVRLLADAPAEPPDGQVAAAAGHDTELGAEPTADEALEEIHVYNAGIVLAAPYLPSLFERLGLIEGSAFKDRRAQERAVHLLQYLVEARSAGPEYRLVVNKLLCGLPLAEPIPYEIDLVEQERQMLDSLLQGLLENWKALGKTSPEGLREAFLQREGRLETMDDAWGLRVESKTYDMLLDQLPWGFSTIRYAWMERPLYVEWR